MTPFMAGDGKGILGAPTSLEDFERKAQMFNYGAAPRGVRGDERASVGSEYGPDAVDDAAGVAELDVADF